MMQARNLADRADQAQGFEQAFETHLSKHLERPSIEGSGSGVNEMMPDPD